MFKRLRAKKPDEPERYLRRDTLTGHIDDVFSTAQVLMDNITPSLENYGFEKKYIDDLKKAVLRGACLDDVGKANSQFQRALLPGKQPSQAVRHEWISTWLPLKFSQLDN